MKTVTLLCSVWVALVMYTPAVHAQAAKAEQDKLTGAWEGWLMDGDGSQPSQRRQRINELVITPAQISARDGRNLNMGKGSYKLGAAGAIKTIDATGTGGPTQGKTYLGIYQLNGDTLKWCSGNDHAQTRPPGLKSSWPENRGGASAIEHWPR